MKKIKPVTDEQFQEVIKGYKKATIKADELCCILNETNDLADELNDSGFRCTVEQRDQIQSEVDKLLFILSEALS